MVMRVKIISVDPPLVKLKLIMSKPEHGSGLLEEFVLVTNC